MKPCLRVAIVNDYEIVVRGVAAMLRPYRDRVRIVHLDLPTGTGGPLVAAGTAGVPGPAETADLTLYDTFGGHQGDVARVRALAADPRAGRIVVYSWNLDPVLVSTAMKNGACGYISKGLPAARLVAALEAVRSEHAGSSEVPGHTALSKHTGHAERTGHAGLPGHTGRMRPRPPQPPGAPGARTARIVDGDWPGRGDGLTQREAEVLALIAEGLTNAQIAQRLHVTPNSVKSFIRSCYRRIGATSRAGAILWAIEHGFRPGPPGP
ncbi:response regulator transcription factor [Pseudactinotalea sp. HY158]|uniref:response regulator transcription factor n=1 Tax=Pseudactinotalea sp. HY158 TaxID=2654547 RepID=UPI001E3D1ECD|nr:response regulator transcription factor [Pseudactinotalea sp. HY158]